MRSQAHWRRWFGRGPLAALVQAMSLALVALVALAGCSASGGGSGINVTLGLQGSTADNPAPPPKLAADGPDKTYAFVYDNQVWAHVKGASGLTQVTRLTLSAGATIEWGPLVWSPSGKSLAFALVQNMATDQPIRDAGQVYYVNVSTCLTAAGATCPVYNTEMTGSVYGHSYDWLNDDWLIAGSGSGISAFDVSDPNGWRTWQLRMTANDLRDYTCGPTRSYGDVQVVGTTLYYTCMTIAKLGATGAVGTATLNALDLSGVVSDFSYDDPTTRDEMIAGALNGNQGLYGSQLLSLGNVYAGPDGEFETGAWRVGGTALVYERIGSVDTQKGVAARTLCATTVYNLGCGSQPISAVKSQPLAAHPQIALGPNSAVAYQGDKLYLSGQSDGIAVSSPYPPVWLSGSSALATNVTATTTDASGVTRMKANLVIAQSGPPTTLIAGASDAALS
ncbi:MAG TPA: hypothetical protein VJR48_07350 [Ktedonobacterales bacterium]|nr:hypothetical protein [Ktedonobacterales bacterium]